MRRLFDRSLAPLVALAHKFNFRMDGTADDKSGREAITGLVTELKGLLSTAKDGASAVATFNESLIKDNYNLRESRRQLKADLDTAKKLPDGARVLQKDEAAEYDKYKALGFKPEDLSTIVMDYDGLRIGQVARDASDALNWKLPVLKKLIESQGLDIEMKDIDVEEEVDGKKQKVKKSMPYVTTDDNKSVALSDFEPLKDFHASLIKDEEGAGAGGRSTQGVRMPAQTGTSSNGTKGGKKGSEMTGTVSSVLESRYKRPEPAKK